MKSETYRKELMCIIDDIFSNFKMNVYRSYISLHIGRLNVFDLFENYKNIFVAFTGGNIFIFFESGEY